MILRNLNNKFVSFLKCEYLKFILCIKIFLQIPNDKYTLRRILRSLIYFIHYDLLAQEKYFTQAVNNKVQKHIDPTKPKILVLTHEITQNGAARAVFTLVKSINKIYGCKPIVIATGVGNMQEEFEDIGSLVMYYYELPFDIQTKSELYNQFDLVIFNSFCLEFLNDAKIISTKKLWWAHEIARDEFHLNVFMKHINEMDYFYGVSPLVLNSIESINTPVKKEVLVLGLEEEVMPSCIDKDSDKITFLLVGYFHEIKGADILLDAIKELPSKTIRKAKFILVGKFMGSDFFDKIQNQAAEFSQVEIMDHVGFNVLLYLYAKADVIVSTSRFESMSIAVSHGLMFSKLCLISNVIGVAAFVQDNVNAVVFDINNQDELVNKIDNIINNFLSYSHIAINGRKVYEDYLCIDIFEENIHKIIDNILRNT